MQLVQRQGRDSPIQIAVDDTDKNDQNHGSSKGKYYIDQYVIRFIRRLKKIKSKSIIEYILYSLSFQNLILPMPEMRYSH